MSRMETGRESWLLHAWWSSVRFCQASERGGGRKFPVPCSLLFQHH
uniref:Uncharacterized protein n=1 Tax=Anguilla anguilla TaxID=7936 RepID=A0A0E9TLP3_ANGAN